MNKTTADIGILRLMGRSDGGEVSLEHFLSDGFLPVSLFSQKTVKATPQSLRGHHDAVAVFVFRDRLFKKKKNYFYFPVTVWLHQNT